MMPYEDEERELLIGGDNDETFYHYCYHTKSVIDTRGCTKSYLTFCACCGPCGFVVDVVTLIPKCIANNLKLCLVW